MRRILHAGDLLAIAVDGQGEVRFFNETAERITGYLQQEILGQDWFETLTPRVLYPDTWEYFQRTFRDKQSRQIESALVTRWAEERFVSWWLDFVPGRGGEAPTILALGRDVTEHVHAQEELRASEKRKRTLLASLPQRIFFKDSDGVFVLVNDRFAADFGHKPQDFEGKSDFDFFPPELAQKFQEDDLRIIRNREPETFIEPNRINGEWRYLEVVKTPVFGDSGAVMGVLGLFTDVTERRQIEQELAEEKELLDTLLQNVPDLIYFKDRESRFTRVNQGFADYHRLASPEAAVGKSDADLYPESLSGQFASDEALLMETGEPVLNRVELQRDASGASRCLLTTKVPIFDSEGQVTGLVGISKDVTETAKAEAELKRTAAELARSNEELQQFAYVASHDLQEPLRMVASYTQLLARRYRDKLDDDAVEFINYAVDGATRMQGLINDLLTYSRVGTQGRPQVETPLDECLDRALLNLQAALEESGANIVRDPLPTLRVDAVQMAQLFQNLIGNAVKFRRDETPEVRITALKEKDHWRISIRDNGIGLEPEYAERIFVIFQRLHTRAEYPGSGIGLSICKKIVERHGGRIWVESTPGEGTTFHFTLAAQTANAV